MPDEQAKPGPSALPTITLVPTSAAELATVIRGELSKGRAFVPGACDVPMLGACELVIVHPNGELRCVIAAQVVCVVSDEPRRGTGLALTLTAEKREELERLAAAPGPEPIAGRATVEAAQAAPPNVDDAGADDADEATQTLQERIRHLTMVEQQRVATRGSLPERIALERTFGPSVWEALLHNQRLSIPEVARIAQKGTLPRPLVELIAATSAWASAPVVQRALLGNPRSSPQVVARVLSSLSRSELTIVVQQTAYPSAVRVAAKKLLRG